MDIYWVRKFLRTPNNLYLFSNIFDIIPCLINTIVNSQDHALCRMKGFCVEQSNLRNIWSAGNVLEVSLFICYAFHMYVQVCDSWIFNTDLKTFFESLLCTCPFTFCYRHTLFFKQLVCTTFKAFIMQPPVICDSEKLWSLVSSSSLEIIRTTCLPATCSLTWQFLCFTGIFFKVLLFRKLLLLSLQLRQELSARKFPSLLVSGPIRCPCRVVLWPPPLCQLLSMDGRGPSLP